MLTRVFNLISWHTALGKYSGQSNVASFKSGSKLNTGFDTLDNGVNVKREILDWMIIYLIKYLLWGKYLRFH